MVKYILNAIYFFKNGELGMNSFHNPQLTLYFHSFNILISSSQANKEKKNMV
jgi:hypothetical protein